MKCWRHAAIIVNKFETAWRSYLQYYAGMRPLGEMQQKAEASARALHGPVTRPAVNISAYLAQRQENLYFHAIAVAILRGEKIKFLYRRRRICRGKLGAIKAI